MQPYLCAAVLPAVPPQEAVDGAEVGVGKVLVEVGEVCAVDAGDGELPCPDGLFEEVCVDGLSDVHLHLACRGLRYDELPGADRIGELRHLAFHDVAADEARVVVLPDALYGDAAEVGVGLQHARLDAEACDGSHIGDGGESRREGVVDDDGRELLSSDALVVEHLDVCAEAQHLVLHLALESEHDSHADEHHGQADGNARRGDASGKPRSASAAAAFGIESFSNKPGEHRDPL